MVRFSKYPRVISPGITVDEKQEEVQPQASKLSTILNQPSLVRIFQPPVTPEPTPQQELPDPGQPNLAGSTNPQDIEALLAQMQASPSIAPAQQPTQQPVPVDMPHVSNKLKPFALPQSQPLPYRSEILDQGQDLPAQQPAQSPDQQSILQQFTQPQQPAGTSPVRQFIQPGFSNPQDQTPAQLPDTPDTINQLGADPAADARSSVADSANPASDFLSSLPQVAKALPSTTKAIQSGKTVPQTRPLPVKKAMPTLDEVSPLRQPPHKTGNKAVVSLADKKVIVYDMQGQVVAEFPAFIGRSQNPTPQGQFRIMENIVPGVDRDMSNPYGGHWLGFARGYDKPGSGSYAGFHGWNYKGSGTEEPNQADAAEWEKKLGTGWKTSTSGCVQLSNEDVTHLASLLGAGDEVSVIAAPVTPPPVKAPLPRGLQSKSNRGFN